MLLEKIKESKNIIISSHVSPDGDAIGSGLSLYLALKKDYKNKNVKFILQDEVPDNLKFLNGSDEILKYENIKDKNLTCDMFITVDSANLDRIGEVASLRGDSFLVNIDHHHMSNPLFGDINIVRECSSASELIFFILRDVLDIKLNKDIAEAIYVGIVTDTGNFKYESTTKDTFYAASELINFDIDRNKITNNIYRNKSLGALKTIGKALSEMKIDDDKKLVYFILEKEFIEKENIKKFETEEVVTTILDYKNCEISVFLKEIKDNKIKGSLRSKTYIDVNKIANLFNGGGHKRAAGFTTTLKSKEIIDIIKKNI